MINFVWKIYTRLVNYDQKVKDEFEYETMKNLEQRFYNLWKTTKKNGAKPGGKGNSNDWLAAYDNGRISAYKDIWNDIHDRYFRICKNLNRLDEFKALNESRANDETDEN